MRRPPASVRHITARPLAFSAVALTVVFTTVCAAAAASFAGSVTAIAVRRSLAAAPGNTIGVSVLGPVAQTAGVTGRIGATLTSLECRGRADIEMIWVSGLPPWR